MKKFLKGAVVLLITVALFLSTTVTAEKETNEVKMDGSYLKSTNPDQSDPIIELTLGPVIFSQPPSSPNDEWHHRTSATNLGWICMDDFWGLTGEICDIHWWGFSLYWTGSGWIPCDPSGMHFEIIFYDVHLIPQCTYVVFPPAQPTGIMYDYELMYWETDLPLCCPITDGWVSIQSTSSPNDCSFLWLNSLVGNLNAMQNWVPMDDPPLNLAFELTGIDNPPGIPTVSGETNGNAGTEYEYTFNAVDPDGDNVKYHIDWDDGDSEETGFNPSGTDVKVKHTWTNQDTYTIKVSAEDTNGLVGPEGTLTVTMPRNKLVNRPFLNFLENHPILYQLLQRFLRL